MTRVKIQPAPRKPQKSLVHAQEVDALHPHPRIGSFFSGVRMPMYKTNDSDDLHLMELISPSHELHRKLIEGNRRSTTQQHTPVYLHSPNKSVVTTPRTKYKQAALKTLLTFPLSNKLNAKLFGSGTDPHPKPKSANAGTHPHCKQRKTPSKQQRVLTLAEQIQHQERESLSTAAQMRQNTLNFDDIQIYKSELSSHRKSDSTSTETSSRVSSERSRAEDQKTHDLRTLSKLWHQDCQSSISIQQQLGELLNSKYKEVFEDGRMVKPEKCKHNDFKAEVAQILKNLESAGAPQMATLNLKHELAVACVDEVIGEGMGEEYVRLEGYFAQPCSRIRVPEERRDASSLLKEIAARVEREYADVKRIAGFMLEQLNPPLVLLHPGRTPRTISVR